VLGKEVDFQFINKPPVQDYMFYRIHEIREQLGLKADPNADDEKPIYLGQSTSSIPKKP
jgi:hypothetical protein